MENEIVNRVANSSLVIPISSYMLSDRVVYDIKDRFCSELILREKDFREHVKII